MYLLARLDVDTSVGTASLYLLVLGLGMGLVMQVLVLAVQNSMPYALLGTATSGVTLLRGVGGSFGTAVFGAIFSSRLDDQLASGASREVAFVEALTPVFLVAAAVALVGGSGRRRPCRPARCARTFARLPHRSMEHHRRDPGRDVST